MPRMAVIPPGLDFDRVHLQPEDAPPPEGDDEPPIWREISRFLRNPRKPAILAIARPDVKKNLVRLCCCAARPERIRLTLPPAQNTLVRAFGENGTLRELCNLVIFAGNRDR
jgi:sucrose-phosphate synthase